MSGSCWAYFIYYRLPAETAGAPWAELFQRVEEATGVAGRLYGPAPDGRTWMEVYEPVPADAREGFEGALGEALRGTGIESWLAEGERRHVEAFPLVDPEG